MYLDEDRFAIAHEERQRQRRRLLATIRGWLRSYRSPRLAIAGILFACLATAASISILLRRCGVDLAPVRWSIAMLASWPLFLALLSWRATAEFRRLHINDRAACLRCDETAEFARTAPRNTSNAHRIMSEEMSRSVNRELGKGLGQGLGHCGLPAIILLAAVTAGTWLLIELVRSGPTLLAEAVIDDSLLRHHPALVAHVHTEPWLRSVSTSTAPYFVGLTLAAFVAGLFFPPFFSVPF